MKPYLLLQLFFILFLAGCNNAADTPKNTTTSGGITETTLPKGKFIIEDDATVKSNTADPGGSINGYNDEKATTRGVNKNDTTTAEYNYKRRYKNLLVFHADDTMKINKAYTVTLILSKDQLLGTIKDEALKSSSARNDKFIHDTTVEIGTKMEAGLIAMNDGIGKGFEIERIGGERSALQRITEKRKKAIWSWKITPLSPGTQNLKLSVSIIEKDDLPVNLPIKDISVVIFAEPESFGSKVMSFTEKNIQWILATLLIPLLMGWYNARMRHKFDKKMVENRFQDLPPTPPADNQPAQAVNTPKNNESSS